ncbi:MAG: hypothetical protein D6685_02800 [Bacteroidetes bacterium]|nr:MAG: hypothetical protein D6685_02800 [Bacteroidota bacterium]
MLRRVFAGLALALGAMGVSGQTPPPTFDLLLTGGIVIDGSGAPGTVADVGIRDGVIVAVGPPAGASALRVIDVRGRIVAPGFIDLHSHADDVAPGAGLRHADPRRRAAPNLVMQGITTVVVNQDGRSPWPIARQRRQMEEDGIGPNAVLLAGHGTIRRLVMGADVRRPATPEEITAMARLVRQALDEGAAGLSAGLEYDPGRWSTTDELVALVAALAPRGGVYIAHQRSEGTDPMWFWPSQDTAGAPTLLDAVRETIAIGERTGVPVVASHLKARGTDARGMGRAAIDLIEQARARGVPVWGDQYPYTTSGTDGHTVLLPDWVLDATPGTPHPTGRPPADYAARLRAALAHPATAARLRQDTAHEIRRRGGAGRIVVLEHPRPDFVGRTLADLAAARGTSPVDMAFALQIEGDPARRGGGRLRGFSMDEADVATLAARPWIATVTDGGIALPDDPPVHPRLYGAFPRKIARYARDQGLLSVPAAIRSATALPAQILGLRDRGLVREGYRADLVVLDLDRLADRATVFAPHRYAAGVDYVFVGGTAVVEQGVPTYARPGRVLVPAGRPPPADLDAGDDR